MSTDVVQRRFICRFRRSLEQPLFALSEVQELKLLFQNDHQQTPEPNQPSRKNDAQWRFADDCLLTKEDLLTAKILCEISDIQEETPYANSLEQN